MVRVGWSCALLLGLFLSVVGCKDEEPQVEAEPKILPPSAVRLDQVCQAIKKDDYKSLISLTLSYKDKSSEFQKQLVLMLKQHDALREKDSSFIVSIVPTRQQRVADGRVAEVYFDVSYLNGKNEEILLPMIYQNGKWWIK